MTVQATPAVGREGFSLVELLVAVVLLGIVLVSLGGLSFQTARTNLDLANSAGRQAVSLATVNHLLAVDYDALQNQLDTVAQGNAEYERVVTVNKSARRTRITVTITPVRSGSFPQTFRFIRAADPAGNPLDTP